ncbi:hypothetical protein KAH94_02520, partial [bacterium]|nr:hypothetical protein [bacterium]
MTVEELRKRADVYLKNGEKKIYATEDGNFFYEQDKPYADAHSRQAQLKVYVFEVDEAEAEAE